MQINSYDVKTIAHNHFDETFWCFTKVSFHYKGNVVGLLVANMKYATCRAT